MSGAHTPEPWIIRTLENFGFNVVHYVGGDNHNISRVAKVGSEADARLVAAAPELLAVASAIDAMWSGDDDDPANPDDALSAQGREVWHSLRAAIAKARGDAA